MNYERMTKKDLIDLIEKLKSQNINKETSEKTLDFFELCSYYDFVSYKGNILFVEDIEEETLLLSDEDGVQVELTVKNFERENFEVLCSLKSMMLNLKTKKENKTIFSDDFFKELWNSLNEGFEDTKGSPIASMAKISEITDDVQKKIYESLTAVISSHIKYISKKD